MTTHEQASSKTPASRPPGRPPKRTRRSPRRLQVTCHLDAATVEALDAEAELLDGVSRSDVIRRACLDWLRRQEKRRMRQEGDPNE